MRAYIIGAQGEYEDIDKHLEYILDRKFINNILIAPDSVVKKVMPLEGNEAVLGLNLLSDFNGSCKDAQRAIDEQRTIFSKPFELAQGGTAISARMPVFKDFERKEYWGLLSITINFPGTFEAIITDYLKAADYNFIMMQHVDGEDIVVMDGSNPKNDDYVSIDFSYENLSFTLSAVPGGGWFESGLLMVYIVLLMLSSMLIGAIVGMSILTRARLKERARRDKLSGLLNRDGGKRQIDSMLKTRSSEEGAFILLDLDHFKSVNDTMGHPKGDQLLVNVANDLLGLFRESDTVCRLGGDEFLVFMEYKGDSDFVNTKAEQIRETIRRIVTDGQNSVDISSSIGISLTEQGFRTFEELYKAADLALYKSKEDGRDRVTFYDRETMPITDEQGNA